MKEERRERVRKEGERNRREGMSEGKVGKRKNVGSERKRG